jgi:cytochrome c-type biogenesis protein
VIQETFVELNRALEGAPAAALPAAFAWGVLSMVLSPCHLAAIPLVIGFIQRQEPSSARSAFGLSAMFSAGILATLGAAGAVTVFFGRLAGDLGGWVNYLVALLFFIMGLNLLDVIPVFWSAPKGAQKERKGLWGALVLGLVFGIVLGPCTFAFMAPVLGVVFALGDTRPLLALLLAVSFAAGHCSVIVFAGTFTGALQGYLDWNRKTRGASMVKKVCGVLLLLSGLYLLYRAP